MGCRSTPISPQAHRLLQLTSSTTFDNSSSNQLVNLNNAAININFTAGTGNVISNNEISGSAGSGIYLHRQSNTQVTGNIIDNTSGAGGGITLGGDQSGITITNNEVLGVGTGASALRLRDDGNGPNSNLTVGNNKFIGGVGFGVRPGAGSYSGTLTLTNNQISGGAGSIQNDDAALAINASGNYFGTSNPVTVAATILGVGAGLVDFTPLLDNDESGPNQSVVGFQADLSSVTVHTLGAQSGGATRINEAIGLLADGSLTGANRIINVAAGTYTENVVLNKQLTLNGAQSGVDARGRVATESIITPAVPATHTLEIATGAGASTINGFTFSGGTRAIETNGGTFNNLQILNNRIIGFTSAGIFLNDPGTDITINQNVVDGTSKVGGGGILHLDQDNFNGFHLTNNNIVNGTTGTGFFVDGNHNVGPSVARTPLISGNLVNNNGTGMNLGSQAFGSFATPNAGTISNNTFSNNTFDGLQGGMQHVLVTQNTFSGNGRSGLALTSFGNTTATRGAQFSVITENFFSGNVSEDLVFSSTQGVGLISTNVAFRNSFGSTTAIRYNEATVVEQETIQASGNWFGSISGPTVSTNPGGTGSAIAGAANFKVDFSPWLDSGTDTTPGTPGFQGSFSALHVEDTSPHSTRAYGPLSSVPAGRIQEAVNLVSGTGSTVTVDPGTYNEFVTIDKSMNLLGAQAGVDARTGRVLVANESVIDGSGLAGIVWVVGNGLTVKVDGFTLQSDSAISVSNNGFGAAITTVQSSNLTGLNVSNNIIQHASIGVAPQGDLAIIQHNLIRDMDIAGPAAGTGLYTDFGLTNSTIDSNTFVNTPNTAININTSGGNNIVSNNVMDGQIYLHAQTGSQVTGNTITNSSGGGIVLGGNQSGIIVTNNEVNGVATGFGAFRLRDDGGGANSSVTATNNKFIAGAGAFGVRPGSGSYSGTLTLTDNQISGGTAAIQNDDAALNIDASKNFWGTSNAATVSASILGAGAALVDFTPLIDNDESVANQSVVGFTPDFSSSGSVIPISGLTAAYQLDGNLLDSGAAANAVAVGSPTFVPGITGQALFTSTGNYARVPVGSAYVPGTDSFSAGVWFNSAGVDPATNMTWVPLVILQGDDFAEGVLLRLEPNRIVVTFHDGSANQVLDFVSGASLLNSWHHVAYSLDRTAGTISLFLDGVQVDSAALTLGSIDPDQDLLIGAYDFGFARNGNPRFISSAGTALDDVVIFDRALAASEIAGLAGVPTTSLTVHALGAQTGSTGRITEGYNALTATGTINVQAGTYTETVNLGAGSNKAVTLAAGASPGQVTLTGDLTLTSNDTLPIEINGTSAATEYDNFVVTGVVTLGGATLSASRPTNFVPVGGTIFTIISNDLVEAPGTFNGLAEGATVPTGGVNFFISYTAGPGGNDVVLATPATVDLSVSSATGTEVGTTVITVTATANAPVAGNQSVTLGVSGTHIDSGDFSLSGTTINILNGATTGTVTFTVKDDYLLEGTETAILTISNPTFGVALGTATQNIAITDNESATLDIAATSGVTEAGGAQTVGVVTMTITGTGAGPGTFALGTGISVTANVTQTGGTATSGADYMAFGTQSVTFDGGASTGATRNTSLSVIDDRRLEGSQNVVLTLGALGGSSVSKSLGNITNTTTIVDNEVGVIDFQADQSNNENLDTTIRAILTITPIGTGTVALEPSLTVVATDLLTGTALSATDYATFSAATLTFSANAIANISNQINSSTATLDVINDRQTKEVNETVNFGLGTLSSTLDSQASLGDTTHTDTIEENDFITVAGLANSNERDEYCLDVTLNLDPAPDASTGYTINWDDGTTSVFGPGGLSNGTVERHHIYDDDFGPGLSNTYNVTVDTVESLGSYTDQATPSPHTVTIHNVNPRDGASFGPVSYTGEDLLLACNSTTSFPSGTQSLTGTRLNLTGNVYEGIILRMPLVAAGLATNATSVTFTVTADWDMLSSDNDLGIAITDGTTAVGSNFGDNGGGFLWGEQGTVSGNRLINTFYPSVGSLTRTTPFTMNVTVASNGQITVSGTNANNTTKTYVSTKTLVLSNQLDLILVSENLGESYGLKTLTVKVAATGTDLVNDGPINEGSTGTVSFVAPLSPNVPFDPSSADTTAGFHYAFDMDNDGMFDDGFGDGTYAGSSNTTGTATVPASFLDDGVTTLTVRGRIIDKDGGFTDYTTPITVNNVAPTATLSNGGAVNEGSTGSVSFSGQIDPSAADTFFGFHYAYDFDNDGIFDNGNGTYAGSSDVTGTATVPASYLNDGPATRIVKARIIDKNDGYTDYLTAITVNNVAPVFDAGANETLTPLANGAFSRTGILISDVSPTDTFTGTVSYGDGSNNQFQQISINQLTRTFSLSHTYATSGTYLVTVTITDDDGGTLTDSFTVTATVATAHLPQVAANLPSVTVNEGQTAMNSGTFADASGHAVVLTASVGTITPGVGTWTWSYATTDGGGQSQSVTITATDSTGAVKTTTFGLTVNNLAPTAGSGVAPLALGPTSYTGADLNVLVGATFPSGTRTLTGTRLNLTGNVSEGIVFRMPLVTAGSISNSQTAVFLVTANWDALTGDNDFGITVSDGVKAVGVNLGDNGGGFLWGEYGTVSGNKLTGVSYPSPGSLARVMSFTMQVTVAPTGITVKGTNGIGVNLTYKAPTTLNLANRIDLILTSDSIGESYGLKTLTTQVNVTGGGGLINNGPKPLNSATATVSFVSPTDASSVDLSAGLRFAYDFNNDGTFDSGNGTYAGSITSSSVSVPAIYLSSLGVRTIRARLIDKDGGFTDYLTDLVVQ